MSKKPTKEELLKVAKQLIVNKEVAKLDKFNRVTNPQTRRVIKDKFYYDLRDNNKDKPYIKKYIMSFIKENSKYQINDILWIREPVKIIGHDEVGTKIKYLSDNKEKFTMDIPEKFADKKWFTNCQGVPNGCIKEMARTFVKVIDVRVERLQDITYEDICKEGYDCKYSDIYDTGWKKNKATFYGGLNDNDFKTREEWMLQWWVDIWNSTAKPPYDWDSNPYVFVYEFERIEYV